MNKYYTRIFFPFCILIICCILFFAFKPSAQKDERFITYTVDLQKQDLTFFWKDDSGNALKNFASLKTFLKTKNQKLLFAMNGGMYKANNIPQGLFIQEHKVITLLDSTSGSGNFYLKPNGVFYITSDKHAFICTTEHFTSSTAIRFATQSGPMLVTGNMIHPSFQKGSSNLNIRNGVGILADGKIVFVMSKKEINFFDFAAYFKSLGCKNALYLDGFVSRMYLPEENWIQTDGNFGVIIGVSKKQ